MKRLLTLLLIVAVTGVASLAPAVTHYYVATDGNDSNDGLDADKAWLTPAKAANTVAAGAHIWIKVGTYSTEDVTGGATGAVFQIDTVGAYNNPIVWEGWNGVSTGTYTGDGTFACAVIDAGVNALTNCVNGSTGQTYNNFKFLRFTGASAAGFGPSGNDRMVFEGCRFDNNGAEGALVDIDNSFALCQFDNNSSYGADSNAGSRYLDCVFFSNGNPGVYFTDLSSIINCLSYGNSVSQIKQGARGATHGCTVDGGNTTIGIDSANWGSNIINCIIYDCTTGINGLAGTDRLVVSRNNLWYSTPTKRTNWPTDPSDIDDQDPLFVGPPDYSLGSGSPALQAGIDAGVIDGITSTSYIDIGAQQAEATGNVIVID